MDYRTGLICGIDLPIPECQLTIHQPMIKEIAYIGESIFFQGVQILCLNKSMFVQDKTLSEDITNFQIFMTIMADGEAKKQKDAVKQVLKLLFPSYSINITPKSIILLKDNIPVMIDESNFEAFQSVAKLIFCTKEGPMDQVAFNPANEQAREIAKKLERGRQRVAAQKGSSNTSVFSQYISILSVGLNISMLELVKLTMFQLYDLMERFNLHLRWDLDIKQRLAGGKPEDKPDNWMKNIH